MILIQEFTISAFSIFAFAEYIVAVANMGYYWTIVDDLPTEQIVVMRPGNFPSQVSMPWAADANIGGSLNNTRDGNGIKLSFNNVTCEFFKYG